MSLPRFQLSRCLQSSRHTPCAVTEMTKRLILWRTAHGVCLLPWVCRRPLSQALSVFVGSVALLTLVATGAEGPQGDAQQVNENSQNVDKQTAEAGEQLIRALKAQYAQQLSLVQKHQELLQKYEAQTRENMHAQQQLAAVQAYTAAISEEALDANRLTDSVSKVRRCSTMRSLPNHRGRRCPRSGLACNANRPLKYRFSPTFQE